MTEGRGQTAVESALLFLSQRTCQVADLVGRVRKSVEGTESCVLGGIRAPC